MVLRKSESSFMMGYNPIAANFKPWLLKCSWGFFIYNSLSPALYITHKQDKYPSGKDAMTIFFIAVFRLKLVFISRLAVKNRLVALIIGVPIPVLGFLYLQLY